jgi:hypothetical protein
MISMVMMIFSTRFPVSRMLTPVGIEIIKAEDAVAALLESEGGVRPDEAGSAGDEDGESVGAAGGGGVADLFFPGCAAAVEGGGGEFLLRGEDAVGVVVVVVDVVGGGNLIGDGRVV